MQTLSAQIACDARNFVLAERHARQGLAIDPNFFGGYVNLGQALAGQNRFDEALVAVAEGYRLAGNAKGLTRRAYVLGRMGRIAEARQLLGGSSSPPASCRPMKSPASMPASATPITRSRGSRRRTPRVT